MDVSVWGAGSAGLLSALTLRKFNPDFNITIYKDPNVPIIPVGESTVPFFRTLLFGQMRLDYEKFISMVKPVTKWGTNYSWGENKFHFTLFEIFDMWNNTKHKQQGFYIGYPYGHCRESHNMINNEGQFEIADSSAFHLEKNRFEDFLLSESDRLGLKVVDKPVDSVEYDGESIKSVNNGITSDFYVDCTGFNSKLSKQKKVDYSDVLLTNSALYGVKDRDEETIRPCTMATSLDAGWLWEIDHLDKIGYGYVYSDKHSTKEQASKEMFAKYGYASTGEIKFTPYRREKQWVDNCVTIGNSAGFIEPLESTSLLIIGAQALELAKALLVDKNEYIDYYNNFFAKFWDNTRDHISFSFILNKTHKTKFWNDYNKIPIRGVPKIVMEHYKKFYADNNFLNRKDTVYSESNMFGFEGNICKLIGNRVPHDCQKTIYSY